MHMFAPLHGTNYLLNIKVRRDGMGVLEATRKCRGKINQVYLARHVSNVNSK